MQVRIPVAPCNKVVMSLRATGPDPQAGVHAIHTGDQPIDLSGGGPWSAATAELKGSHPKIDGIYFQDVEILAYSQS